MNTYNRYLGGAGGSTNGNTPLSMLNFFWQFKLGDGGPEPLEEGDGDG